MIKKLICWLVGHNWQPLTPQEIESQFLPPISPKEPVKLAKCARCGVWK